MIPIRQSNSKPALTLTIMNDEDIDYAALTDEVLAHLALSGELYIATSAISELSMRTSPSTASVALDILSSPGSDQYLQAAALDALFAADAQQAVQYMREHIADSEPYLLEKSVTFWKYLPAVGLLCIPLRM